MTNCKQNPVRSTVLWRALILSTKDDYIPSIIFQRIPILRGLVFRNLMQESTWNGWMEILLRSLVSVIIMVNHLEELFHSIINTKFKENCSETIAQKTIACMNEWMKNIFWLEWVILSFVWTIDSTQIEISLI